MTLNLLIQIVPGSNNGVAIELITTHIRRQLQERSNRFRPKMAIPRRLHSPGVSTPETKVEDLNLSVLRSTPQVQGIFTILRSADTTRQDFIFFVDRLSTFLVEYAMSLLPHAPKTVMTPVRVASHGQMLDAKYVCGVCIQRS